MRETLAKLVTKSVEHRFEKRFENFKADIRDKERELDQIRTFLTSSRRERDGVTRLRKLEAAETLLKARDVLSKLTMLVEYMKILDEKNLLAAGDDPKVLQFINMLIAPLKIDETLQEIGAMIVSQRVV